jgi:hypothetical protein
MFREYGNSKLSLCEPRVLRSAACGVQLRGASAAAAETGTLGQITGGAKKMGKERSHYESIRKTS